MWEWSNGLYNPPEGNGCLREMSFGVRQVGCLPKEDVVSFFVPLAVLLASTLDEN